MKNTVSRERNGYMRGRVGEEGGPTCGRASDRLDSPGPDVESFTSTPSIILDSTDLDQVWDNYCLSVLCSKPLQWLDQNLQVPVPTNLA